jgi:hemoglobin-like flavoprotein
MPIENRLLVKTCIDELTPQIEKISALFYRELFRLDKRLESVFSGNVILLNRKFSNMLGTLKNVKHLEQIRNSVEKMGERHHHYGAEIQHFPTVKRALLSALRIHLGIKFTPILEDAWSAVFEEVATIMEEALKKTSHTISTVHAVKQGNDDTELLTEIGGEAVIFKVHERFYDVMFDEPWLETFFLGKSKESLIIKQTQFMVAAFGGENHYHGDTPAFVHMHLFITEEMSRVRQRILREAILAEGLSVSIAERWLKVDYSFWEAIIKKSVEECVMKCQGQVPIVAKKPIGYQVIV